MAKLRRTALVTGGASGIGAATCRMLARKGVAVAVLDINLDGARSVSAEIAAEGGISLAVKADIADRALIDLALQTIRQTLGPITVLINNASVESFMAIEDIGLELWQRQLAVNLTGVYQMIQATLPDMHAAGWGRIVNISAIGAQTGATRMAHYTASKGGVIAMTRSLAVELGPRGITVNSVSPGFILTPMSQRAIEADLFGVAPETIYKTYPIPRMGAPDEVAAACAFFASEEASYITGQLLGVNGGAAT